MVPRAFYEQEYCKEKVVSCIRFHPTKPHLVAMALVEHLDFQDRTERSNKFVTSHVLILNFSDAHIITLNYILTTPVEITVIEFHPENPNILVGGALNGQVLAWDIASPEHRIQAGRKRQTVAKMPDEEEDKTQQVAVKLKQLVLSNVEKSHRSFVADLQFIPGGVKVDKKHPNEGKSVHFLSCSEDGHCLIWDTRAIDKHAMKEAREKAKNQKYDYEWIPWLSINLFRQDGSGEVGLSRTLMKWDQDTPTFYGTSDEGELFLIDWSIKPISEDQKVAEHIRMTKDCERNYRPVVALERSPFYEDLILTVHDFHFAIWKTSLDQDTPIYRSANTFESHNTCGAFSPTRPGVIFITKTSGIDVWDFVDQSNKPSLTLNIATNPITTFKFQHIKDPSGKSKSKT